MEMIVGMGLFAIACVAVAYWPRTREQEYFRRHRRLMADMRRRSLSPEQQTQEMRFRRAWAALRRRASEEAMAWPAGHAETIANIGAEEAKVLALVDKDTAKRFLKVVNEAPLSDILYPEAMKAVHQDARSVARSARVEITDDMMAAVTPE